MTDPDIGYAEALAELEDILDELDGDEVDVDVLGARVRRAATLLRLCRDRIASARFDVEQVVAELEAETASASPPAAEPVGDDGQDEEAERAERDERDERDEEAERDMEADG